MAPPTNPNDSAEEHVIELNRGHPQSMHIMEKIKPIPHKNPNRPWYSRAGHSAVEYKKNMYIFGGYTTDGVGYITGLSSLAKYDPCCNQWFLARPTYFEKDDTSPWGYVEKNVLDNQEEAENLVRHGHSAVVYKNSMFVFGGVWPKHRPKNDLYEYIFDKHLWKRWTSNTKRIPAPRCYHAAAIHKNMMFIYGGLGANYAHVKNDMWMIPLDQANSLNFEPNARWIFINQLGDIQLLNHHFSYAQTEDFFYTFGGNKENGQLLRKFNFQTKTWKNVSKKNNLFTRDRRPFRPMDGNRMVPYGTFLYLLASKKSDEMAQMNETAITSIYRIDTETDEMELVWNLSYADFLMPYQYCSVAVVDGFVYIYGGTDGDVTVNDISRFKLSDVPGRVMEKEIGLLLQSKELTDVLLTIKSDEKDNNYENMKLSILTHSAILAARSPYLKNEIEKAKKSEKKSGLKLGKNHLTVVELDDITPSFLEMIVEFIYTDRIKFNNLSELTSWEHLVIIEDLCEVARKFEIILLHRLCLHILKFGMVEDTPSTPFILPPWDRGEELVMDEEVRTIWNYNWDEAEKELRKISLEHSLVGDLENIRKSKLFCDFHVSSGLFRKSVHKFVLAARSHYFRTLFHHTKKNDTPFKLELTVMNPPASAMKSFVTYMYTDNCPKLTVTDAIYLFNACHFFCLGNLRLQGLCKEVLETEINDDNVFDIIKISTKNNQMNIREFALDYAIRNRDKIVKKRRFAKLDDEAREIIRLSDTMVSKNRLRIQITHPFPIYKSLND